MKNIKKTINVGVVGAAGRMGIAVAKSLILNNNTTLKAGIETKNHKAIGVSIGSLTGDLSLDVQITDNKKYFFKDLDVVIEFGLADATKEFLLEAKKYKVAYVSGSTGLNTDLLKELSSIAARKIGSNFDIDIIDLHHKSKKDTPSGTAISIKNDIEKTLVEEKIDRKTKIIAMRSGDSTGEHTVLFSGPSERLEFKHISSSREIFSDGAVKVAKWLVNKSKGFYQMHDYLDLKGK